MAFWLGYGNIRRQAMVDSQNAAVDLENAAVRIQNEAVDFRNEAVKRTFAS